MVHAVRLWTGQRAVADRLAGHGVKGVLGEVAPPAGVAAAQPVGQWGVVVGLLRGVCGGLVVPVGGLTPGGV